MEFEGVGVFKMAMKSFKDKTLPLPFHLQNKIVLSEICLVATILTFPEHD